MANTASLKELAKARRIHNARHAKAIEIAPLAEAFVRSINGTEGDLIRLPEAGWLRLAQEAGKAGPKGLDVPSPETRGIVVDMVMKALAHS